VWTSQLMTSRSKGARGRQRFVMVCVDKETWKEFGIFQKFYLSLAELVWSREEPAVLIPQSGNLPATITGGMSYQLSVGLNCTHCFIMVFCISKIIQNDFLSLKLANYFLLQLIQFLAVCGGVVILWRHLWKTSVSSFMSLLPFEYISSAPTGRIFVKLDVGGFH
jgi:hypothetical protein